MSNRREAFEKYMHDNFVFSSWRLEKNELGKYKDDDFNDIWEAVKWATEQQITKDAEICDKMFREEEPDRSGGDYCALAIQNQEDKP